jgi:hypothetical protein
MFNGEGVLQLENGIIYKGNFKDGLKSGEGIITFKDGSSYEGQFFKNYMHGKGIYKWKNDEKIYEGEWN